VIDGAMLTADRITPLQCLGYAYELYFIKVVVHFGAEFDISAEYHVTVYIAPSEAITC